MAQVAAELKGNSLEDNARLFASLNIAIADATISCWDAKYEYDYWRPITAIRADAAHDERRVGQLARPDGDVEPLCDQVHVAIRKRQIDVDRRVLLDEASHRSCEAIARAQMVRSGGR